MGLISAFTLIRAVSLFHITAAYYFLAAPKVIADQNVVFILGESMGLPQVTGLDKSSEASAFIAVILAFLGVADLTAASLPELPALEYWSSNTPVRLVFLFALTAYTYLFKSDGVFGSGPLHTRGIGEPLKNGLVFSWGFLETAAWMWVFVLLREERRSLAIKIAQRRAADEDR